jgi:membrane protein
MSTDASGRKTAARGGVPGGDADTPTEIPAKGWFQIAKRGWKEAKVDHVPLLGAGVAFYAFLALFPALIALVSLYGLFAEPATIANQVSNILSTAPADVRKIITDQVTAASSNSSGLGLAAVLSILLALFSASGGVNNLMKAINVAYDEEEKRNFLKQRGLALLLTVGAVVFMVIVLGLVTVVPPLLQNIFGDSPVIRLLLSIAQYVLLALVVAVALAILYRVAPDRDAPQMKWTSVGALVATVLWLVASIGFSVYVANFGGEGYAKTYGAVAGIIIALFWLWITAYAILLGAEINAEAEQQTAADTTKGPEQPIGERDAVKADSLPEDQPEPPRTRART